MDELWNGVEHWATYPNPDESVTMKEIKYLYQLGPKDVIEWDFNAQTILLVSEFTNRNFTDKMLESIIVDKIIYLINPHNFLTYNGNISMQQLASDLPFMFVWQHQILQPIELLR